MKYAVFISLFAVILFAQQQLTPEEAMTRAEAIWGVAGTATPGKLGMIRASGDAWMRQIGYTDLAGKFRVVGEGRTWREAFNALPVGYVAPTKHTLQAETFNQFGVTITASESIPVLVCNTPCVPGVVDREKEEK